MVGVCAARFPVGRRTPSPANILPATAKSALGVVVPIPTFPLESIMKAVEVALRLVVVETMKRGLVPAAVPASESNAPGLVVPIPKNPAPLIVSRVFRVRSLEEAILNLCWSFTSTPRVHLLVGPDAVENSMEVVVALAKVRFELGVVVPMPTLELPLTTKMGVEVP